MLCTAKELQTRVADTGSQDNNIPYFKRQTPTWLSCQKEQPQLKIKHLKHAKENIEKPEAFWNNVLWTTKAKWNFLGTTKQGMFVEKKTLSTVKHGGGSIMLWTCVAAGGTGNIVRVEGRMDITKYQYILEANVLKVSPDLEVKERLGIPTRQ